MANFEDIAKRTGEPGLITFKSVTTGQVVAFPAFITSFNDNFTIGFGGETTFGRNDPVKHYQSTSRQMQVALDILSVNKQKAIENFQNYSKMIQMCYPVYSAPIGNSNKARTIKAPPIWRIKYANYISSPDGRGLLGTISGISFSPKFEQGHFIHNQKLIPVVYNLNFNFQPLHEDTLGFNEQGQFLVQDFPYRFKSQKTGPSPLKLTQ